MPADEDVDRLYGLPLEEFVAERDALAKRLRKDGDREGADAVKALPKPTRAAWVVNRLARERPDEVRGLVDVGEALAGAQEELLGGGEAKVLRDAADAARHVVDALVDAAGVGGPTAEKVRATLHAATVDEEARRDVAAGRVVKERAAAGFGGLEALAAAAAAKGGTSGRRGGRPAKGARAAGGAKGRSGASSRSRRASAATKPAPRGPSEREVKKRRDAVRRAAEAEAVAEADVAGARHALAQVEATLAARRRDLEAAEKAVSEARARRERAEQQLP